MLMQGVVRAVARSARAAAAAAGYHSRRCFVGAASGGVTRGTTARAADVRSLATVAEPAFAGEATRRVAGASHSHSHSHLRAAQGRERFWTGYCVVVYGGLLCDALRRFKGYHDEATAASSLQLVGSVTADY